MDTTGQDFGSLLFGAGTVAIIGVVMALWDKIGAYLIALVSPIIGSIEIKDEKSVSAIQAILQTKFRRIDFGVRVYLNKYIFTRPLGKHNYIPFESTAKKGGTFWYGFIPIWIAFDSQSKDNAIPKAQHAQNQENNSVIIRYIRGTFSAEWFIKEASNTLNELEKNYGDLDNPTGYRIEYICGAGSDNGTTRTCTNEALDIFQRANRPLKYRWGELGPERKDNALSLLELNADAKEAEKEIEHFLKSRKWYRDRGFAWRRGFVLFGPPGTGKTSFVRAVGEQYNLPIYSINLAGMNNGDFIFEWTNIYASSDKRIILIEDIDSIFDKRKNITKTQYKLGVTFDCLLNAIDGVERMEGTLLFITTNNIEKLDPALGNSASKIAGRPGRVDRLIEFNLIGKDGLENIATRIFEGMNVSDDEIEKLLEAGISDTPAQFQERCFQIAIKKHYLNG